MKAKLNTYDMQRTQLHEVVPLNTPYLVALESSFACNFHCTYCIHSLSNERLKAMGYPTEIMSWDTYELIASQLEEFPNKIKKIAWAGLGEPLLNDLLPDMIADLKRRGVVEKVMVISNGTMLTRTMTDRLMESGLDELKISLQGLNADRYQSVCGTRIDFDKLYGNIAYAYKNKRDCVLKVKMADIALDDAEDEKLFFDLFGNLCDYISIEHISPLYSEVDYTYNFSNATGKNRFGQDFLHINTCWYPFFRMNIHANGDYSHCIWEQIDIYSKNNIVQRSIKEQWEGMEHRAFQKSCLVGDNKKHEKCRICRVLDYNWHPEDILDGHEDEILARILSNDHQRME